MESIKDKKLPELSTSSWFFIGNNGTVEKFGDCQMDWFAVEQIKDFVPLFTDWNRVLKSAGIDEDEARRMKLSI